MKTLTLENEFIGTGEVKGFKFQKINSNNRAFMYKVTPIDGNTHFEVFERKTTPLCIDFENRVYSETDFKEIYPKSNHFGVWAWCISDEKKAIEKFNSL